MAPRIDVTDIGNMPYPTVRTILMQVPTAKQLRQLEESSPQLEGEDVECWHRLIRRDFPVLSKKHNFEPKNPASWYLVYAKYERLEAEQKRAAEAKLKAAFAGLQKEKAENVSHIVASRKLPRPPKDGRGIPGGARRTVGGGKRADDGDMRWTGGSRTKTSTGAGVLRKARREAREISARNRLATPTGLLPVRRGQIASAPQGMVEEVRIKAQPAIRGAAAAGSGPAAAPGRNNSVSGANTLMEQKRARELDEREARLRQLKNAKKDATAAKTTVLEDSDLDEEGGGAGPGAGATTNDDDEEEDPYNSNGLGGGLDVDDLEDLFDEKKPSSSSKPSKSAAKPATPVSPVAALLSQRPINTLASTKRRGLLCNAPGSTRSGLKTVPRPRSRSNSTSASASATSTTYSTSKATSSPTSKSTSTAARHQQPQKKTAYSPPVVEKKQQQSQQLQYSTSPTKQSPPAMYKATATTSASSMSPEMKSQASGSGSASATSPTAPTPTMSRKRKPVDIFMKPKPKMQKR